MLIATRVLMLETGEGGTRIPVDIGLPRQHADGWQCDYSIGWPHEEYRSEGWGVDAIQAILLTLQKIAVEVYTSSYHLSGRLTWIEGASGYGFPVAKGDRDLLTGDDLTAFG